MRIKYAKFITFFIIITNIIVVYYTWKYFISINILNSSDSNTISNNNNLVKSSISSVTKTVINHKLISNINNKNRIQLTNKHLKKSITVIFNGFSDFDNDLRNSIDSIIHFLPTIQIILIFHNTPYPPLEFLANQTIQYPNNIKVINLNFDITKTFNDLNPLFTIKTKYVVFMPDSVRINGRAILNKLIKELNKESGSSGSNNQHDNSKKVIAIPFASNVKSISNCYKIKFDSRNWTIEYRIVLNGSDQCDMFLQKHAILVETVFLKQIPVAFSLPFPEMFYIQAKVANIKLSMINTPLQDGKRLFTSYHTKQMRQEFRKEQFKKMYQKLKIKKIVTKTYKAQSTKVNKQHRKEKENEVKKTLHHHRENNNNLNSIFIDPPELPSFSTSLISQSSNSNSNNNSITMTREIEYFGCEKNTPSCIVQVFNSIPFFIYVSKNTPPCCMEKLKNVFHHVINEFENVGIRYWLDNAALKNAIEFSTLALDSFEIDISFNMFDLVRSNPLKKAQIRPFTDEIGYYWIKATDGEYFKVQYSKINQIGVNLLPFELNGERVKPSGFYGWKAKEFSVEYLHPMSTVMFLSKNIMCPNNVREFLDIKNN